MLRSNHQSGSRVVPAWHAGFLAALPGIRGQARAAFQHLSVQEREEALAEVTAVALVAYLASWARGELERVDCRVMANAAVLHVQNGQRACGPESSQDVLSPTAQRRGGFRVQPLKESWESGSPRERVSRSFSRRPARTGLRLFRPSVSIRGGAP
jgi:hypothetical protein